MKNKVYFWVASYFVFWARLVLKRWKPQVIVVTGSSGKTTLLHMLEAQIGNVAHYSHHANGAFGIPFDILGLPTNVPAKPLWLLYMLRAPLQAILVRHKQRIYIAEADCDRPHEGYVLARLLQPDITLWVSVFHTHSQNFDHVIKSGAFNSPLDAIANEFSQLARATRKLVIYNADNAHVVRQMQKLRPEIKRQAVSFEGISNYSVSRNGTSYILGGETYAFSYLLPPAVGVSLGMVAVLLQFLGRPHNPQLYASFAMPPGRSTIFNGVHNTTLVDSTYNTGVIATKEVMMAFAGLPQSCKWLVIGDVLEQGSVERSEHEMLARHIIDFKADRVILLGRRQKEFAYPILQGSYKNRVESFLTAGEVLAFIQQQIQGGEAILFKGAQGLEGVVEQLLADSTQSKQLVRRGSVWVKRRRAWGLPS